MSIAGIDWDLADRIYAREEDKILEDTKKRKQEIAQDCQKRGVAGTTPCLVEMRRADMEKLDRLAEVHINADWQIVSKSGVTITDNIVDNIVARLNRTLSSHIKRSVTLYGAQKEYSKAKASLLAKARRELEIRKGLLAMEEMKKKRFQFLHKLYEMIDGDESKAVFISEIGNELGFDETLTEKIVTYLSNDGLVKRWTFDRDIIITHDGFREVERALSEPDKPTEHFPPASIIYVGGNMVSSQVQQASPGAKQTLTVGEDKLEELQGIIQSLKDSIDNLRLEPERKSDLQAEIQTIEAQVSSSRPKRIIITESLSTIRGILQGAAGSLLASELLSNVVAFLSGLL